MKLEKLTVGRLYEIVHIPHTSCWDDTDCNMVGNIIQAIAKGVDEYCMIWVDTVRTLKGNYTPNFAIYISGGDYRLLNNKDTAKIQKELSNA